MVCDVEIIFYLKVDSCRREMKVRVGELLPKLRVRGKAESLVAGLFTDDTELLADNEGTLQRIVD